MLLHSAVIFVQYAVTFSALFNNINAQYSDITALCNNEIKILIKKNFINNNCKKKLLQLRTHVGLMTHHPYSYAALNIESSR